MPFLLAGVNHKSCPLDIREKFFLQPAEKDTLLAELKSDPRVLAAIILSTCNRTEIYLDLIDADPSGVLNTFFRIKHIPSYQGMEQYFYTLHDEDAVRHLFRVVSGMDSLILGEKQILGQVKGTVACSQEKRMMNRAFNLLSNMAIETGKKVRRETSIDFGGSSVSWAAVVKAEEILGTLEGKNVLLMGSGKMGALASQQLQNKKLANIFVMNRTQEKAEELAAQCGGTAVSFWQIRDVFESIDVCICSTGAPHYLADRSLVEEVMALRPERPMAIIDIAVPRNIDPQVAGVEGVSLLTVDELAQTLEDTMNKRKNAVELAERIIAAKVAEFYKALDKAVMYELLHAGGNGKEAMI